MTQPRKSNSERLANVVMAVFFAALLGAGLTGGVEHALHDDHLLGGWSALIGGGFGGLAALWGWNL